MSLWLKTSGLSVDRDLLPTCQLLSGAKAELFASYMIEADFLALRARGHAKEGTIPTLRKAFAQIAAGAREVAEALRDLRREIAIGR